jgi:two-component system response regulator NreC
MAKTMRILVADDHQVVREGLRVIVEREPGWKVCGEAGNGKEAIELAEKMKPEAVILDLKMPETDSLEAIKQIKRVLPQTEVLALSTRECEGLIEQVFESGAKSYLRKAEAGQFLVPALRSLQNHKTFLTEEVSTVLFSRFLTTGKKETPPAGAKLTAHEREIVRHLAEGSSNKEIALALKISVRTCETHRAGLMRKLRLNSLPDIVRYAIRHGIVDA